MSGSSLHAGHSNPLFRFDMKLVPHNGKLHGMKIAMIDPSLFTWPYDAALAEGLESQGHEVLIYGRRPWFKIKNEKYLKIHFYRALEHRFFEYLPDKPFLILKGLNHIVSMFRLIGELRRQDPDIIHIQWSPLPVIDRLLIRRLRKVAPIVFTVHDSAPFNESPASRVQQLGSTEIMKHFDRLIVHTDKARQRVESYGVPPERISRIAHGILDAKLPSATASVPLTTPDVIIFLLFGYIKPYKGLDILLDAFASLPAPLRKRSRVRIVGKPHMDMSGILNQIEELAIGDRVDLTLDFIEDDEIGPLFASSDVVVFPYREIDASGVLMLALQAGKPIIASEIGLFAELLAEKHGALLAPGDTAGLSRAMSKLIEDAEFRADCSRAVRALNDDIPSWTEIGRLTSEVYSSAIRGPTSAAAS